MSAAMKPKILLVGGGGHAKVVLDALLIAGYEVVGVIDSKYDGDFLGVPRTKEYNGAAFPDSHIIVAVGDNASRMKTVASISHPFATITDLSATVSRFSTIGNGSMILHGAIIQPDAKVGKHVIINTGAQVDHDCSVGDYVHIAPRAVLCGNVRVGEGTLIGAGAVVLPGVSIGKWCIVGAGSVVRENIDDLRVVAGVPARIIKK